MNSNNTPVEFPIWQNGVIYEPITSENKTDHPNALEPHPTPATLAKAPAPHDEDAIERHRRKCTICHHPERESIEEAFLNWQSPHVIVNEFKLPSRSALYRHAEATGLPALRRRRMHLALDRIIERADSVPVTGNTVLRAIIVSNELLKDEHSSKAAEFNDAKTQRHTVPYQYFFPT